MIRSKGGADTLVHGRLNAKPSKGRVRPGGDAIKRILVLLAAALREIFDESAYQRFLARGQLPTSPATYSDFLRESESAKARRPRCC